MQGDQLTEAPVALPLGPCSAQGLAQLTLTLISTSCIAEAVRASE